MDDAERSRVKTEANKEIGRRLAQLREKNGYTQEKFAEILDLSVGEYRKLERGTHAIHPYYFQVLRKSCNLDPGTLIMGEPTRKFDVDLFLNSCDQKTKEEFFDRVNSYVKRLAVGRDDITQKKGKSKQQAEDGTEY